jgi:5-methylcytosine-specific restriction endonuclease McrA
MSGDLAARSQRLVDDSYRELWATVAETASILSEIDPPRRRPWLVHILDELHQEQGGWCALCGAELNRVDIEVDHIIPFCYGGGNERGNIQLVHVSCNRSKRATVDVQDLLRYLEDRWMNR